MYRKSKVRAFLFVFALKTGKKPKMHANICEVSRHLQEKEKKNPTTADSYSAGDVP